MTKLLFGVAPTDIQTLGAAMLVVVGGLAALLPARRAAKLEPVQVFRER